MTAGVHIKDIDRPDFFGIDHDGSFFMPGRERVPTLTVLHLASTDVMEDELRNPKSLADFESHVQILATSQPQQPSQATASPGLGDSSGQRMAGDLADTITSSEPLPYRKIQAIVAHLRREFEFDRNAVADDPDPLRQFLIRKRGGDHLFATAAAVMGRAIGLNTRLVSGVYVRPDSLDLGQGHASIMPDDVHLWVEVQLNDGRWIEIEATPGYEQPVYRPSKWLMTKRMALAYAPFAFGAAAIVVMLFLTRVIWFELFVPPVWLIGHVLGDRHRVRVLLWILQQRGRLAGKPRRSGLPQRDWILAMTQGDPRLAEGAVACCDAADRLVFGGQVVSDWSSPANLLVRRLTTRYMSGESLNDSPQLGASA